MKRKNAIAKLAMGLMSLTTAAMLPNAQAQTVLSGDHVVEGNLEVGTPADKGNLTITGETGNLANPGIRVTGDGGVVFEGTLGTGKIPVESFGTRFMWYPGKAALRVGEMNWYYEDEYIGIGSVAFGNGLASGADSVAMSGGLAYNTLSTAMSWGAAPGYSSTAMSGGGASGDLSTAMSYGEASGDYSTAMNSGVASGDYSTAMNWGSASGLGATAICGGSASGPSSTAMSFGEASGVISTAMSYGVASGGYSTAMSYGWAQGDHAIAGGNVISRAYQGVVLGSFNDFDENESPIEWVETDPIFVVGNGRDEFQRSNAFVIQKNGNVEMMAKVKMPRQGDILMGEFGETEP